MYRTMIHLIWPAALAMLWAGPGRAEALVPSPSVPALAEGDGWAVALGAAAEYEAEYDGSDDYGLEADPVVAAHWRRGDDLLFLEGNELGWRGLRAQRWLLQTGLRFEGGRDEDDADELEGLGDTDDELMAMGELRRGFGPDWRNWLAARLMAGDGDIGAIGILAAGHRFVGDRRGDGIEVFAFTTFATSDFINRDFGVTASQSENSGLEETDLDGGFRSVGVTAIGRWSFRERWQLGVEAGFERYSNDIADSPIAQDDYEVEVGVSLTWRFGSAVGRQRLAAVSPAAETRHAVVR
jgi:outer membrane scaffolding protein for murein synthesis (MipA/OmpV family)